MIDNRTMTTMTGEPHAAGKAAKVLAAAEELFLVHGFKGVTMSAVAQRAHVGKGTPYLYWRTKEDLFIELVARSLADTLDDLAARVGEEPSLAVAGHLVPTVAEAWLARPLVRALQVSDDAFLGALLDNPRTRAILAENGAPAVLRRLLPIWREHGSIRTDRSPDVQASALELLAAGFFATQSRSASTGADPDRASVLRIAVADVLDARGPDNSKQLATKIGAALQALAEDLRDSTIEQTQASMSSEASIDTLARA